MPPSTSPTVHTIHGQADASHDPDAPTDSPLVDHVEHFRHRVLQEALATATGAYWLRRAATFEAARPRPGDFTGRATAEEIAEQDARLLAAAAECRGRAADAAALVVGGAA